MVIIVAVKVMTIGKSFQNIKFSFKVLSTFNPCLRLRIHDLQIVCLAYYYHSYYYRWIYRLLYFYYNKEKKNFTLTIIKVVIIIIIFRITTVNTVIILIYVTSNLSIITSYWDPSGWLRITNYLLLTNANARLTNL